MNFKKYKKEGNKWLRKIVDLQTAILQKIAKYLKSKNKKEKFLLMGELKFMFFNLSLLVSNKPCKKIFCEGGIVKVDNGSIKTKQIVTNDF